MNNLHPAFALALAPFSPPARTFNERMDARITRWVLHDGVEDAQLSAFDRREVIAFVCSFEENDVDCEELREYGDKALLKHAWRVMQEAELSKATQGEAR